MDWHLAFGLLFALTTTSAYNYDYYNHGRLQSRRVDYTSQEQRSERMNERSISVSSGIQRVQEKERRRVESYSDEPASRSENGSYKIVNNQFQNPSMSKRGAAPDSVVFPGRTSAGAFELTIPPDCEQRGFCENIPNYPEELVKSIIAKLPKEKIELLRVDRVVPEIAQRTRPTDIEEVELCTHHQLNYVQPEAQKDIHNNWQLIINDRSKPLQGYRVEMCRNEGKSCATNVAFFYDGYTSSCKQKYTEKLLATVDKVTGEAVFNVPFKVPTCCVCVAYHMIGN